MKRLIASLLFAVPAFAEPVILSVTPNHGPAAGGTEVRIVGRELTSCIPMPNTCTDHVLFGVFPAETRVIDDNTVVAIAPPNMPGPVHVSFRDAFLQDAFTYEGEVPEAAFERILLPLLTPPVRGAFGSEFRTELRLTGTQNMFYLWGLDYCPPHSPVLCIDLGDPIIIEPRPEPPPDWVIYSGTPGRFLAVPINDVRHVAASLRVYDVTRSSFNFGTEIPIVRYSDFSTRVVLLGVPTAEGFRNTLRIYSDRPTSATVTVEGQAPVTVTLRGGETLFDPAYAAFSAFPRNAGALRVTIDSPDPAVKLWAFVSVTNNATQLISTISPQP